MMFEKRNLLDKSNKQVGEGVYMSRLSRLGNVLNIVQQSVPSIKRT
jgi:hypothetical protein